MIPTPTLATKLGTTTHLSPLLHKARRLGLDGEKLQILAVQRGCDHYRTGDEPETPLASESALSNEELAIALLCVALPYDPRSIRCGAAMLGADGNSPEMLVRQTILERSEMPVRYVALAGRKFEPENPFWSKLLSLLPDVSIRDKGAFPDPAHFVSPSGSETTSRWIRPRVSKSEM